MACCEKSTEKKLGKTESETRRDILRSWEICGGSWIPFWASLPWSSGLYASALQPTTQYHPRAERQHGQSESYYKDTFIRGNPKEPLPMSLGSS